MGTKEALKRLRDAIDKTLLTGEDQHADAFVADGEGYQCVVSVKSLEKLDMEPLPYTDSIAGGSP